MRLLVAIALAVFVLPDLGHGQSAGGFKSFKTDPNTAPRGHRVVADPTGAAPTPKVHQFVLRPGRCSSMKHVSSNSSDCKFKSMRATAYEPDFRPKSDEWVSWSMYLPSNFPIGREQKATGLYTFAYWHNTLCPHVSLVSDTKNSTTLYLQTNQADPSGKWNCVPRERIPVTDLRNLRGKWNHFELHTVFSKDERGAVELFLNGKRIIARNMPTIAPGPRKTYFIFGLYLCCTAGTENITPAAALYSGLSRATTREGLR